MTWSSKSFRKLRTHLSATPFCPGLRLAGADGRNAGGVEKLMHLGAELRVSIEDQVLVVPAFRDCFAKLLHHPFTGGVLGDIQVDDLSAPESGSLA
jgi:hypothetical protein